MRIRGLNLKRLHAQYLLRTKTVDPTENEAEEIHAW